MNLNWKVIAIVLMIVLVLVACYSFGFFETEEVEDGTVETSESFEVSASIQSDFWDGFTDWLWGNLWWMTLCGVAIFGFTTYSKSRY